MKLFTRLMFLVIMAVASFTVALHAQERDTFWDKARAAAEPAAGHYAIGEFTYDGAEFFYNQALVRIGMPQSLSNEFALLTTLGATLAFEYDPLFNPETKIADGVSVSSVRLDGGFDALERSASGIANYLGDVLGSEFNIGFRAVAFLADLIVTTQLDRDLRR